MAVKFISDMVYHWLCHKIGTPQEVSYRREMSDIKEFLDKQLQRSNECEMMLSGSNREGFRLKESDIDLMLIESKQRIIWNISHSVLYNRDRQIPILCVTSESPPGFALLQLTNGINRLNVVSACVQINGILTISSSKFRELRRNVAVPNSIIHGPCSSACVGGIMFDHAHCFVSDFWPPAASSWIDRCQLWPPQHVTDDIVRKGCHFVAIGHKVGNYADIEWRISFSQAENKLVYSMNHTQFLTYGLLKLFLNEVINAGLGDEEKLLCSYHMKTAIFWAIQQNMLTQWHPENMLAGFWVCFKIVLKWVYKGVCPNFFIPQNNLFLSRIYGEAQENLFRRLYELYEKGLSLLLHLSSIRQYILEGLTYCPGIYPGLQYVIAHENCTLDSGYEFDINFFDEIHTLDLMVIKYSQDFPRALLKIEQLVCSPWTRYQLVLLQKLTATILQHTAFVLHDKCIDKNDNKTTYSRDNRILHMLRLSMKFGHLSDMLYLAMFYYKTFRYKEALSIIEIAKVKMSQSYVMFGKYTHIWNYIEAVGGQSWSTKIRKAVTNDLLLYNKIFYIPELVLEQQSGDLIKKNWIQVSPFILSNMLEFLICKHNDTSRAQSALDNIQALVQPDQEGYLSKSTSDISWEILGICQQINGDIQDALISFQQSLRHYSYSEIQLATRRRIQDINDQTAH